MKQEYYQALAYGVFTSVDKKDLEYMMHPIVSECLDKYKGGESYFNELDSLIKNDEVLMVLFLAYAVQDSGIHNVILSGEIGAKYTRLQLHRKIPEYINIGYVNGGLRKGDSIRNTYFGNGNCIPDYFSNKVIFIDDSYYSGKTANKVRNFIESLGGEVIKNYVFYDGSKEKHDDVVSLYRYYN